MYSSIGTDLVVIPIINGQFDSSAFVPTLTRAQHAHNVYHVFLEEVPPTALARTHTHTHLP